MSLNLSITLILVSVFLMILTTYVLKKGRIPEKYSLLWYGFSIVIMLTGLFPNIFSFISVRLGFQVMSSLVVGFIIGVLILITMSLTIMIAGQKKKTTLLIQEISILKKEVKEYEEKGK